MDGNPEDLLQRALANVETAVALFGADRRVLAVNDRYLDLTGYTLEEALAHAAGENLRLDPLDQAQFIELITSDISAGEADIFRKNGQPLALEYVVIPTLLDGQRYFIGIMWPLVAPTARPRPSSELEASET